MSVLKNENLHNWHEVKVISGPDGKRAAIEEPDDWEVWFDPTRTQNAWEIANSLHDDAEGWKFAAAYIPFQCGLRQGVQVEGNKRYLLKMEHRPLISETPRMDTLRWMLSVGGQTTTVKPWRTLAAGQNGKTQTELWVFETTVAGELLIDAIFESPYGAGKIDEWIHEISLTAVPMDYGGNVPVVTPYSNQPTPEPSPAPAPTPEPSPAPLPGPGPTPAGLRYVLITYALTEVEQDRQQFSNHDALLGWVQEH